MPNTLTSLSTSAQYFSTRGCANGFAQYKCPVLRLRSVQVPNAQIQIIPRLLNRSMVACCVWRKCLRSTSPSSI
ncbi:hypothetical protein, partial [Nostoc sp.]